MSMMNRASATTSAALPDAARAMSSRKQTNKRRTEMPVMKPGFYKERTLYYKRLRDQTDNPELYVAYEREMQYNFRKYGEFVTRNMVKRKLGISED